ncbi:MAG: L-2-amino-thiazoline-4-carboxylic acid hydrolase [Acidimicrobiia bacterium]|nr:L-2-amino-thiazoline-4-carboxylic acid hydrolase [Acidimicrobiia bacterium]
MNRTLYVEELEYFGKPVSEFPKEAERKQARAFMRQLRARYGTVGLVRLLARVMVERRRLKRRAGSTLRRLEAEIGPGIVKETMVLVPMFEAIAAREGRENAYPVIRSIVEEVAPCSMRAMYQVDDLKRCDGDVFDNFKRFHFAMFDAKLTKTLYANTQTDEGDHFATTVERCANVEIFTELGYPELGPFGCDHDVAGYAAIADEVGIEFRRPCTIAKGAPTCDFRFYRAGTAPDTELIDGVPVQWTEKLNR